MIPFIQNFQKRLIYSQNVDQWLPEAAMGEELTKWS